MMLNNKGSNINHSGMPCSRARQRLALFCARAYTHIRTYVHTYPRARVTHSRISRVFIRGHTLNSYRRVATGWYTYVRTYVRTKQQSIRLTAINTLSPCTLFPPSPFADPVPAPVPPLLYHPQRCTRMVQLTHRTIMRYRNSARCPCSTRTARDEGLPFPAAPVTRTASSPRPRRAATKRKIKRCVAFVFGIHLAR